MIDSVKTRMPTKEESESMMKTGPIATRFLDKLRQFPPLEINTYELIYESDELVLFKKFGPKEVLLFVDSISESGNLHKKYPYIDQILNRFEFTSYSLAGYPRTPLIQETDGAYWYESQYEFTYEYEENALRLVTGKRHDGETAETKYFYDENGLVTGRQTGLYGTDQFFEEFYTYEYYD
ncbi:MAG: hypothetical protein R8G66_28210 [Cytophagales bacterium]|nr:hypothetical protein [Cytophagales bacterium]